MRAVHFGTNEILSQRKACVWKASHGCGLFLPFTQLLSRSKISVFGDQPQFQPMAAGCWLPVAGCWLLAAGCWLLAAGHWPLAAGHWPLAVGCWLLARGRWLVARGYWLLLTLMQPAAGAAHY